MDSQRARRRTRRGGRPADTRAPSKRQLPLDLGSWGGVRAGAGRRPNSRSSGVSHLRRPAQSRQHPLHVTLRVRRGLSSFRAHALFRVIQRALSRGQERFGFRLVHFSVQRDHLHLIAEASDRRALSRGVQGLSIRVARAVNRQVERSGPVFADRYHARALKTPRAVHFALRYVLLNARKHERGQGAVPAGFVDPCSSSAWFAGFGRPTELVFGARQSRSDFARSTAAEAPVTQPRTWLLRIGHRRAGAFDLDDVPG